MKAVLVLLLCSILQVNSDCVPEKPKSFASSLVTGTWYLKYIKSTTNIFDKLTNIIEQIQYSDTGSGFVGTLTATPKDGTPEIYPATWTVNNTTLDVRISGLEDFNGRYRVISVTDSYFICHGFPKIAPDGDGIVIAHLRRRCCSNNATVEAIKKDVAKQCWDFKDFRVDPFLKAECSRPRW